VEQEKSLFYPQFLTFSCFPLFLLQLVSAGRTVIAASRNADKATQVFEAAGLKEGYQKSGRKGGILVVESGVDVTSPETLTEGLFRGVTQVSDGLELT
jgi:hypothetical protein